jgi:hypothetical protein
MWEALSIWLNGAIGKVATLATARNPDTIGG